MPASRAVVCARPIGLASTRANFLPARSLPSALACRSPLGVSAMLVRPVCWPLLLHSVSPCRTSQIRRSAIRPAFPGSGTGWASYRTRPRRKQARAAAHVLQLFGPRKGGSADASIRARRAGPAATGRLLHGLVAGGVAGVHAASHVHAQRRLVARRHEFLRVPEPRPGAALSWWVVGGAG